MNYRRPCEPSSKLPNHIPPQITQHPQLTPLCPAHPAPTIKRKNNNGIYFITVEKKNSAAEQISDNLFDPKDPRNEGIIQDVYIGAGGQQMRRIVYRDPRDEKNYTYITNELTLPAFALVLIYKHRWDVEKVFYQLKSKFNERKCWASSLVAKEAQAIFECLAHNLCLLIENQIITEEHMRDEVEERKKKGRRKSRNNRNGEVLREADNYINQAIQRATHHTQRFIRWLPAPSIQPSSLERISGLTGYLLGRKGDLVFHTHLFWAYSACTTPSIPGAALRFKWPKV